MYYLVCAFTPIAKGTGVVSFYTNDKHAVALTYLTNYSTRINIINVND